MIYPLRVLFFTQRWRLIVLLTGLMFLSGCDQAEGELFTQEERNHPGVNHPVPHEGDLGIVYRNGVECLSEEARPREGDALYVSPEGNDNNPGTADAPLRSLASAACSLLAGQTLYLLPGVYYESVLMGLFGNSSAPITLSGIIEGDQWPVLNGEYTRSMGIALVESKNFVIENIEFRNYNDEGLYVLLGEDITIRDCRFIDNGRASIDPDANGEGFGLNLDGVRNALIERNQFVGNGPNQKRWKNFTLGTGINTYELFDSIIRDNYIAETIGGGILVEDGGNVLVENNTIENNELDANGDYWDGGIWVDGSYDVTLRGNTIRNNHGPGIVLSDEDVQYPGTSFGIVVEDNLVTGNLTAVSMWNYGICPPLENAIIFGENRFENNEDPKLWCSEWECGEGQACE